MNPLRVHLGFRTGTVICTPPHGKQWLVLWDGRTVGEWCEAAELESSNA